jgi:hypothetical protein
MGLDLGEVLTYSAVAMNPGGTHPERIFHHQRSQGHLMEPLRKFKRWLNHNKPEQISQLERGLSGANSPDFETFRTYALRRVTSEESRQVSAFYNRKYYQYRKWQMRLALKKGHGQVHPGVVRNGWLHFISEMEL